MLKGAKRHNLINNSDDRVLLTLIIRYRNVSSIFLFSEIHIRTILLRVFSPSRTGKSRKFRRANLHLTTEYHRELVVDR